jgi:signal peptide peptidase SppA
MMKQVPSIFNFLGIKATSTEAVRAELQAALESDRVESIVLDIDSPGGTVDGTAALAADVLAMRDLKPITTRVDDLMASAALWVGSQADEIHIGPSAAVGSIGVYAVVDDKSRQFENKGITTHVVSSGTQKGAFVEGSHVTEKQLGELQRNINTYTKLFVEAVSEGRGLDASELATGQMWIGKEAVELGLADAVVGSEAGGESDPDAATVALAALAPRMADLGCKAAAYKETLISQVTNAATAAQQETETMTEEERKEMERLRAENAALTQEAQEAKATADQAAANLKVEQEQKKEALLNHYADRIPPAARDSVAKVLEGMTPDEADAYLRDLPQLTKPNRETVALDDVPDNVVSIATGPMTVEEKSLGKAMGQSHHRIRDMCALSDAVVEVVHERVEQADGSIIMEPRAVMKDGSQVNRTELKKRLGLKGALFGLVFFLTSLFAGDAGATALSAERRTECRLTGITKAYLMTASSTISKGSLVMVDSNGTVVAAAASASNNNVAGVAQETKTSAATGSYWIRVSDGVICKFAGTTLGQDDVGSAVYAEDDQTVDETVGSNQPIAGVLVQYVSASEAWIYVSSLVNFGRVNVSQPITLTADLTLANAEVIDNDTDDFVCLVGSGGTSDEDICFDLDGTNTVEVTSTTSADILDFSSFDEIILKNDETIKNDNNGEIELGNGTEDVAFSFGSNTVVLSTDTSVAEFDFGSVGTTLKLANDQTIVSDEDNYIKFADGTESIEFGFATSNTVDFTSDDGVNIWDFAATGSKLQFENDQILEFDEDNVVKIGDAEDIEFGFGTNNTVVLTSDSGVTKWDFGTMNVETDGTLQILGSGATIGWTIANSANQACSTTCAGTGSAVVGIDSATHLFVLPNDATADGCICAGPAS